jgi:uncharacterized C2H2 Zn-finger protein
MSPNPNLSCEKDAERYWRCPNCKNMFSSAESVPCPNNGKSLERYYRCPICKMLFNSTEDIPPLQGRFEEDKTLQYTFEAQVHKMNTKLRVAGVLMFLSGLLLLSTQSILFLVGILQMLLGLYFMLG